MEQEKQVQTFRKLCENSIFAHREEILKELENGNYDLEIHESFEVPSQQLLDIYERRADHLLKYESEHGNRLRSEVLTFCIELKKIPKDIVYLWTISTGSATGFSIFYNSQKILGCLLTVDRRMVSEAD